MATLNTLRTRFGVVLSAVIAFALLAFIFSLKSEMGFSGNDPVVAKINGHDVTISEYSSEYNKVQRQSGVTDVDEQQADMLFNATWQSLISTFALQPGFEEMGVQLGAAERMAIISGEIPTQAMYSAFADPSTGLYNVAAVNNFLLSSQNNLEAESMWNMLNEQARMERQGNKYMALISAGINLNSLEIEDGVEGANKSYAGRWATKAYSNVADSLANVSAAEVKSYYESNKAMFERQPSRTISYVTFTVAPSESDLASLQREANSIGEEFNNATDLRAFIREHRNGSISNNYISEAQLPAVEADKLVAGEMYGPATIDNSWRLSRVFEKVSAPDTISIRHIVLPYTAQSTADSLKLALNDGADFQQAAMAHSVYSESAQNGGEIGAVPFSAFSDEFASELISAKKGDIVEVTSGDMIQLIQVYEVGESTNHYKIASINTPILPSEDTRRAAHNAAGVFAVAAKGNYKAFEDAAIESEVLAQRADLTSANRTVPAVEGSQEIARWAHRADINDLSEIFKVNDGYLVAMLTAVDDSKYTSMKDAEAGIKRTLMNDKKFEILKSELSGSTLDAVASSMGSTPSEFSNVNFSSYFVPGIGVEPRVIGAITSTSATGSLSNPVKGSVGLYVYEVSEITDSEEPQTADAEKIRAEAMQQRYIQQMLFGTLESLTDIEDMRGANL